MEVDLRTLAADEAPALPGRSAMTLRLPIDVAPEDADGQGDPSIAEAEFVLAEIEHDSCERSGAPGPLLGEPVEVLEIVVSYRRRRLDFDTDKVWTAVDDDVDLAPIRTAPMIEPEIALLQGKGAQQLVENEALENAAECGRIGADCERRGVESAKRAGHACVDEMELRILDLPFAFPGRPRAELDDQGEPHQHVEVLVDGLALDREDISQFRDVDFLRRARCHLIDEAPQLVGLSDPQYIRDVAVDDSVDIVAILPLPGPQRQFARAGIPAGQHKIDVLVPRQFFGLAELLQFDVASDRPIEQMGDGPLFDLRYSQRPKLDRPHSAGERIGHGGGGEDVRRPGQDELALAPLRVDNAFDRKRQRFRPLGLIDDQRRIAKAGGQARQLAGRIGFEGMQRGGIIQRDEVSGLEKVADKRRLSNLPRTDQIDDPGGFQGLFEFRDQMPRKIRVGFRHDVLSCDSLTPCRRRAFSTT